MSKFINSLNIVSENRLLLQDLEIEYTELYKGIIYQTRRGVIRDRIKYHINKCKNIAQGPVVYIVYATIENKRSVINLVDMTKDEIQLYLELITNQNIEITHITKQETGKLEFLE